MTETRVLSLRNVFTSKIYSLAELIASKNSDQVNSRHQLPLESPPFIPSFAHQDADASGWSEFLLDYTITAALEICKCVVK